MMTEDEAAKRWCPMGRQALQLEAQTDKIGLKIPVGVLAVNRFPTGDGCRCMGSNCMMWRWVNGPDAGGQGYCGLGGEP